jgi:glycine hydroxymethyltransferase
MLKNIDPNLYQLIQKEHLRQINSIELIASENYTSNAVLECLGSCLVNKYSEGSVGRRYYGGNQVIDEIETLCNERALKAFHLDSDVWSVNVQPYSGSVANLAAYNALLQPHDRIMGLGLESGGHLTHGYYTSKKKVSVSSIFYESFPYHLNQDGYIDYDKLEENALLFNPKLIICGGSAYSRDLDYKRFREIADKVGAYLLCDMSHFNGFVATQQLNNPFEYCDVVTTTTHKLLRGPRSAMIFSKKELSNLIDLSVFPSIQGGPHNHQIGALAVQLKEVMTDEYEEYIKQVHLNIKTFSDKMIEYGYHVMTNGTDTHLVLINVKKTGLTGSKVEKICEYVDISLNKNSIYGDTSAFNPSGIRIGSPWMTTRGCKEREFVKIAEFIHRCIQIGLVIQEERGKMLKDFVKGFEGNKELEDLKKDIQNFMNELNDKLN